MSIPTPPPPDPAALKLLVAAIDDAGSAFDDIRGDWSDPRASVDQGLRSLNAALEEVPALSTLLRSQATLLRDQEVRIAEYKTLYDAALKVIEAREAERDEARHHAEALERMIADLADENVGYDLPALLITAGGLMNDPTGDGDDEGAEFLSARTAHDLIFTADILRQYATADEASKAEIRSFHLIAGPAMIRNAADRIESGELKPDGEQDEDDSDEEQSDV